MLYSSLRSIFCLVAASLAFLVHGHPSHRASSFSYGHDLSSVKLLEDGNVIWKDTARKNMTRPVEDILGDGGMNAVRLRIWVNPDEGLNGLAYNLNLAKRFSHAGYAIYLDFHFADSWADPSKQPIPAAWPKDLAGLQETLQCYVRDTLLAFHHARIPLAIVSLGNEIRNGMLWPVGKVNPSLTGSAGSQNFASLAKLLQSARRGVSDATSGGANTPLVMIHIDNGWDSALQQRWFAAVTGSHIFTPADWDVFGFSFYPFYGTSATFANLKTTLNQISAAYRKPVYVAETDFPQNCAGGPKLSEPIPASVNGQIEWTKDVVDIVRNVEGGWGKGVFYWEPAWLNNTGLGSACESAILFSGDYSGYPERIVGLSDSSVNLFKH